MNKTCTKCSQFTLLTDVYCANCVDKERSIIQALKDQLVELKGDLEDMKRKFERAEKENAELRQGKLL